MLTSDIEALPTVAELFRAQVARTADATAVTCDGTALTYRRLDDRSTRLARRLRHRGLRGDRLAVVLLDNSVELIVALLAIMKSGAGYVPVNPGDPLPRIDTILRDAAPHLIVTRRGIAVPAGVAPVVDIDAVDDDGDAPVLDAGPTARSVAYVIYTSGSTGRPKGVVVEHRALSTYLTRIAASYPGLGGRTLVHSSASFDMAVTSLFGPLIQGGSIEIVALEQTASAEFTRPSFLKVAPGHLSLLRNRFPNSSPTTDLVIGGEALSAVALDAWRDANPATTVVNEYGPTEATVGCCLHRIPPRQRLAPGPVPIGAVTGGSELYVLDPTLGQVDAGELYIAGDQLARGYLGMAAATAAAFVANPFGGPGARMYRTGDRVRRGDDGNLEFVGRTDGQVKVGGFRVEPAEVAAALARSGDVADVVVTPVDSDAGRRLVAYVTPAPGGHADGLALREYLANRLPGHMIPVAVVVLDALPLTANGKVDHHALPAPTSVPAAAPGEARTRAEELLCGLIADLVGVADVGVDEDFFGLGGNSLAAARLVTRARRDGIDFTLTDVLNKRTARRLLAPRTAPATR